MLTPKRKFGSPQFLARCRTKQKITCVQIPQLTFLFKNIVKSFVYVQIVLKSSKERNSFLLRKKAAIFLFIFPWKRSCLSFWAAVAPTELRMRARSRARGITEALSFCYQTLSFASQFSVECRTGKTKRISRFFLKIVWIKVCFVVFTWRIFSSE